MINSHLLEEDQPIAILGSLPNIRKPARRHQTQNSDARDTAAHQNELKRVGPNDGLEPTDRRVEDAD